MLFCCGCLLIPCWGLAYDFEEKDTKSGFLMGAKLGYNLSLTGDIEMSPSGSIDFGLGWRFPNNIGIKASYIFSMHNVDSIPVSLSHQNQMGWGGLSNEF